MVPNLEPSILHHPSAKLIANLLSFLLLLRAIVFQLLWLLGKLSIYEKNISSITSICGLRLAIISYQVMIHTQESGCLYSDKILIRGYQRVYRLWADRENGSQQKHKDMEFQKGKVMILQDSIAVNFTDRAQQIMQKLMVRVNMKRII
jgi:hypothetical protein